MVAAVLAMHKYVNFIRILQHALVTTALDVISVKEQGQD